VSIDYSQIELRLLADRAHERKMIQVFESGGDIHTETAMRAFGIDDPAQVDKISQRNPCKNVNFGIVYGLTASGLYDLMAVTYATAGLPMPEWLDIEWCERFIEKWFNLYPDALEYFQLQHWRARRYEMVWDMFGRTRLVPEVRSQIERVQYAGLRQAGNLPIQAAAAGVMKIGMARVERVLEGIRASGIYAEALLPVHDELLIEVDAEWAEEVEEVCRWEMERALVDDQTGELRCRVPIKTEGSIMTRWSKAA
jgi:DNA polymerase-1